MKKGVVLGKFMPPHAGHLHLISEASRQVDGLTILVCSLAGEPIPGEVRYEWMRELRPNDRVVHVTDPNPSDPHGHAEFWEIWSATIREHAPGADLLFTSEDYGDELASRLGATHVTVDPDRTRFPVSGRAVRNDPFSNWSFIPSVVRPWFVKRVVLTGSECVGKTTLAREPAEHFETIWVPEFGREYVDSIGRFPTVDDIEPIARGQIEKEDALARQANRILIQDTDLVSTCVFAEHYYDTCPQWIVDSSIELKADLYLLLDIDTPWIADPPNRDRGHMREEMQGLFRRALSSRGIEWIDIRGSWQERRATAIAKVEELLG